MKLTNVEIEKLKTVATKAAPGPWCLDGESIFDGTGVDIASGDLPAPQDPNITHLVAFNPAVTMALIEEVLQLRKAVKIAEYGLFKFACEDCRAVKCRQCDARAKLEEVLK